MHGAFGAAFADYLIGPFQLPAAQWPVFLARQGVDLAASRVVLDAGAPVAFCLVAPRPEAASWRLATMGAVPATRGSGAAQALLDDMLARARASGVADVELECFAQNGRALRLYESRGFCAVDALHGHERDAGALDGTASEPARIGREEAFTWLDGCGCELPMQVTSRSLRALAGELHAWRHGSAQVLFAIAPNRRVQVHCLVDRDPAQRDAQALVAAVACAWPGHSLHVPQLQRLTVGGEALDRLGFRRSPLHQLWMRRPRIT